jgi:hypothetical protein
LVEKRLLNLCKLGRIHYFENVLHFVQEHDLLGAVYLWPVAEEAKNHLFGQSSVLFKELDNAVCQLRMVHAKTLDFVKRNQDPSKEQLVLLLQWQGKAVDDRTENLEELRNTIEPLGLIDELEEDVVDGATDVGSQVEEFSVYAMQSGFEEVALSGVFGIEQLEKLGYVSMM